MELFLLSQDSQQSSEKNKHSVQDAAATMEFCPWGASSLYSSKWPDIAEYFWLLQLPNKAP